MADDPKDLARRFYAEVINGKNLDVIDELVDDDLVEHQEMPGMPPGKDGVRAFFDVFHAAFPDLHADIQGIVSEGDPRPFREDEISQTITLWKLRWKS